jgi:hypothetical protein
MICDFCSEPQPAIAFEYPCRDFVALDPDENHLGLGLGMNGSWLACSSCSELIERGMLSELATRQLAARDDLPEDLDFQCEIIGLLVQTFMRFQSLRMGPRRELQPA